MHLAFLRLLLPQLLSAIVFLSLLNLDISFLLSLLLLLPELDLLLPLLCLALLELLLPHLFIAFLPLSLLQLYFALFFPLLRLLLTLELLLFLQLFS